MALIKGFKNAVAKRGKVIVTDVDPASAGLSFCDSYHIVPLSSSPQYIPAIMDVCVQESISILIPTIDEELSIFGSHKEEFAKIGVTIPVSSEETGNICNDKYETYLFFKKHGLPVAETWLPEQIKKINPTFPLFIKPRIGRGAVSAYPVNSKRELDFFLDYVKEPVVQQFLAGKEYTVDILSDLSGKVLSVVPRQRVVIRSGVSDRGITWKNSELMQLSQKVAEELQLVGATNLQCMVDHGKITFFEVNPRFSGAIQLTIAAGADFPQMIVDMMEKELSPTIGEFEDKLTMVSYEDSIYRSS